MSDTVSRADPIRVVTIGDAGVASVGSATDTPADSDTGDFSLIALFKYYLQRFTILMGRLPAALSTGGAVKISVTDYVTGAGVSLAAPRRVVGSTTTLPDGAAIDAGEAISNSATDASVVAASFTIVPQNDQPVVLPRLLLHIDDIAFANKSIEAYVFRSDPTADSGIVGAHNEAFSVKSGTFMGRMAGTFAPGFSDGAFAELIPINGNEIIAYPTSGAATIFVLYKMVSAVDPTGVAHVITPTFEAY